MMKISARFLVRTYVFIWQNRIAPYADYKARFFMENF